MVVSKTETTVVTVTVTATPTVTTAPTKEPKATQPAANDTETPAPIATNTPTVMIAKTETPTPVATKEPTLTPTATQTPTKAPTATTTPIPTVKINTPIPTVTNTPTPTVHVHNWTAMTETVHHPEEGHWETVDNGYDEEIYFRGTFHWYKRDGINRELVSEYELLKILNLWNWDQEDWKGITKKENKTYIHPILTSRWPDDIRKTYIPFIIDNTGSCTDIYWKDTYIETIHHEKMETVWVVDTPAWDETVTTGYKCDSCGATK